MNWDVVIPGAFALTGVTLTALAAFVTARRKNLGDDRLQFIAVLQAERATSDGRADKAEARADASDSRAKRWETLAWRYYQQLLRSSVEPVPAWPTDEMTKVKA